MFYCLNEGYQRNVLSDNFAGCMDLLRTLRTLEPNFQIVFQWAVPQTHLMSQGYFSHVHMGNHRTMMGPGDPGIVQASCLLNSCRK